MKFKNRVLVVFVIVSALFICLCGVYSYAEEYYTHTYFVSEHFEWVQDDGSGRKDDKIVSHYPGNVVGSCPYTAMSLFLSFYDAYWDDRFVPNDYESVGCIDTETGEIWRKYHLNIENGEWDDVLDAYVNITEGISYRYEIPYAQRKILYDNFIEERKDDFFQLYMISLGKARGYHNDTPSSYAMSDEEQIDFLNYYLQEISKFDKNEVEVKIKRQSLFTSKDDLFEIAKQQIKAGFPVIYTGDVTKNTDSNSDAKDDKKIGHVMLLYELTLDEQDIVLSKCWNGEETQTFYNNDYDSHSAIIYFDTTNLQHTCSDNYFIHSAAETGYCVCKIFKNHPNHTHNYIAKAYDDSVHWNRCLCGDKASIEEHNIEFLPYDREIHVYKCNCGYRIEGQHCNFTYQKNTDVTHTAICECGYKIANQEHFESYSYTSKLSHKVVCPCGYSFRTEAHTMRTMDEKHSYCTKCKYVVDMWTDPNLTNGLKPPEEEDK